MKQIFKFCLMVIGMVVISVSCQKEVTPIADCGCNSPTVYVIDSVPETGRLGYDTARKEFVISKDEPLPMIHSSTYLCSGNITYKIDSIRKIYPNGVDVEYWGEIKKMCDKDIPVSPFYGYGYVKIHDIKVIHDK